MNSRDQILHRIRRALAVPSAEAVHPSPPGTPRAWLPAVGESSEAWPLEFAAKAAGLGASCHFCADEATAHIHLRALAAHEGWRRLAAHGEALGPMAASFGLPVLQTDAGYDPNDLEQCDAALTGCDALVAQTGSVLLSTASAGGRGLSILPPHHVVLARREQLLPDLPAAFALLASRYGSAWPSMVSLVTGPSRTGDIERILVLGAHGPKKLTILVW